MLLTLCGLLLPLSAEWNSPLFYSLRLYLITAALFAAIHSVHTVGLTHTYKQRMREREAYLNGIPVTAYYYEQPRSQPSSAPITPTSNIDTQSATETPLVVPLAVTAQQVAAAIDNISKRSKAIKIERRLVLFVLFAAVRAAVALNGDTTIHGVTASVVYFAYQFVVAFVMYSYMSVLEFELHDDEARLGALSVLHLPYQAYQYGLPFYLPLIHTASARTDEQHHALQNVRGFYEIRQFFIQCKGKFDHFRLETVMAVILLAILSVSGWPLYLAYFHSGNTAPDTSALFAAVVGHHIVVFVDTLLLLLLLVDIVGTTVKINSGRGRFIQLIRDEQLKQTFLLSASKDDVDASDITEMERTREQLNTLIEQLSAIHDSEKQTLFGYTLDDSFIQIIRGTVLSYVWLFGHNALTELTTHDDTESK